MSDILSTEYIWVCCHRIVYGPRLGQSTLYLTGPCPVCSHNALVGSENDRIRIESRRARLVNGFWEMFHRQATPNTPEISLEALQRVEAAIHRGRFSREIWAINREETSLPAAVLPLAYDPSRELRARIAAASQHIAAISDIPEVGMREIAEASQAQEQFGIPFHPLGSARPISRGRDRRWRPYTIPARWTRPRRFEEPAPQSHNDQPEPFYMQPNVVVSSLPAALGANPNPDIRAADALLQLQNSAFDPRDAGLGRFELAQEFQISSPNLFLEGGERMTRKGFEI